MVTLGRKERWSSSPRWPALSRRLSPRHWAYQSQGGRDLRLDLVRGFFVVVMVADHIGGNSWLNAISGNNAFVVSAAEGFVFVSGILMGIVYGKKALKNGLWAGVKAVLHRAWYLYLVATGLTLACVGLLLFTNVPLFYDRNFGLGVASPLEAVLGALTLHYSYNGTDILTVYVQLAAVAPIALYLLVTGRTSLLLAGSWLLWGLSQFYPSETQFWPVHNSMFSFAGWQLLFYNGMALGFHREQVGAWLAHLRGRLAFAMVTLAAAGVVLFVRAYETGQWAARGLPVLDQAQWTFLVDKGNMGFARVVAFAVLALFAQQLVTRFWVPLSAVSAWLLLPLGQSSLVAYGAHLFFIGTVQDNFLETLYGANHNVWSATLVQGIALVGLLLIVRINAARPMLAAGTLRWLGELNHGVVAPALLHLSSIAQPAEPWTRRSK